MPAALMIAAEYDRSSRLKLWRPKAVNIEKWRPGVRHLLEAIGFFQLSGVDRATTPITNIGTTTIRRLRACNDDPGIEVGNFIADLGLRYDSLPPEIYTGLVEAILNAANHAYEGADLRTASERLWWICGSYDQGNRSLICCVYDHGVSIPVSLSMPTSQWEMKRFFDRIWRKLRRKPISSEESSNDGPAIGLAMRLGHSRTGKVNRGNGLPAIDSVIELCEDGYVAIRSRRGEYRRDKGSRPTIRTNVAPIHGTLVMWRVKLPETLV